jgi:hypothetical protein
MSLLLSDKLWTKNGCYWVIGIPTSTARAGRDHRNDQDERSGVAEIHSGLHDIGQAEFAKVKDVPSFL